MPKIFAYVGCYTESGAGGRGQGISIYQVDPASGRWTAGRLASATANPSFLTIDPSGRYLYCVHGGAYSEISAFAIDRSTGDLALLNSQPSGGRNPVHLDIEPTGRMMVVANYTEGTVASLPIAPDGSLEPPTGVFSHRDMVSSDASEPIVSQPHHSPFDPAGRFVAVPDKGLDRLFVYRADPESATLTPNDPPMVATHAGAGPRHIAFHPTSPYAYVVNEVDPTVSVYDYDAERGSLQPSQIVSGLPAEFTGVSTGAEIAVAPSGRFLYASIRGHDSIAVFAIDQDTGRIAPVEWVATGGRKPRFFTLDPQGNFLYAANQDSDTIVPFRVDSQSGTLSPVGEVITTGSPVSIAFVGV